MLFRYPSIFAINSHYSSLLTEDIKELNRLLDIKQEETGLDVKIHVDAASGGFVAPFVVPDLEWDFRLREFRVWWGRFPQDSSILIRCCGEQLESSPSTLLGISKLLLCVVAGASTD